MHRGQTGRLAAEHRHGLATDRLVLIDRTLMNQLWLK